MVLQYKSYWLYFSLNAAAAVDADTETGYISKCEYLFEHKQF